ncbi:uncharacterized protein ARMOST_01834 [Armillaria ostoyae]|uniref:Uncharacterized protein n=1 Tax=Armillaria ostoyae TaxID=47428 RepID=A0A284QQ12_ARMOS|nr:uncharacterized protein ARMOST_01834 [Armillaria ostoyae]
MSRLIFSTSITHFATHQFLPPLLQFLLPRLSDHDPPFHPNQTSPHPPPTARRTRRAAADEKIAQNCPRCHFSTNYRDCLEAHKRKYQYVLYLYLHPLLPLSPARRPRVVRACMYAPSCLFRCSDLHQMARHRRVYHRTPPFIVLTPESMALDEVIAGLTNLAVGQTGPSLQDPASSSTGMAVDEVLNSHDVQQNQPTAPPPFNFDGRTFYAVLNLTTITS